MEGSKEDLSTKTYKSRWEQKNNLTTKQEYSSPLSNEQCGITQKKEHEREREMNIFKKLEIWWLKKEPDKKR